MSVSSIRRGLAFSISERYVLIAISLLGNIVLARLLTPEEIGLYSVSLAVIGIAQVLRDFGMGSYLIQEKDLKDSHIRTVFGISLLIGSTLFLLVFLSAPALSEFYAEAEMVEILWISSLNFLVLPFCTISLSLLRRSLIFDRLAIVSVGAAIVGFIFTVGLAWNGFGAKSMAISAVITNIVTGVGAWFVREDRKILMPGFSEWRSALRFGSQTSVAAVITSISMDINDLVVGRILGMGPVALISRAQGLAYLLQRDLMGAVRGVVFPVFAKFYREGQDLELLHIRAVSYVTVFAWPFYAFVSLYSLELIRFLFGNQWDESARLVPWFCLAGAVSSTCNLVSPLLVARGRIDLATRFDLTIQPISALFRAATVFFFLTIQSFAIATAIIYTITIPFLYYLKNTCQVTDVAKMANVLKSSLIVTLLSISLPVAVKVLYKPLTGIDEFVGMFFSAVLCVLVWIVSIYFVKHPLYEEEIFRRVLAKFSCSLLRLNKNKIDNK